MTRTVFFDLDGTLTDPKTGITRCIQHALEALDHPVPTSDELTWCIGPPLVESFQVLVGAELADEAVKLYRERFGDVGWAENAVYPDIPHVLTALREWGAELYVATSKPHVFAQRIVEHFGIAEHFHRVFGSELDGTHQNKADLLGYALSEVDHERPIMIGDREHDVFGAAAHNLPSIGVAYGYGSVEELERAGAHHIAHTAKELVELIPAAR